MKAQQADYDPSPEGVARRQVMMLDYLDRIETLLIALVNKSGDGSQHVIKTPGLAYSNGHRNAPQGD